MGSVAIPSGGGVISKVYYLYLGSGTSFNVKNAISASSDHNIRSIDYTTLTNNDFVIEPTSGFSYSGSGTTERYDSGWSGSATNTSQMAPSKSYNTSTGVLAAKYDWSGGAIYRNCPLGRSGSVSCKAYLVHTED